MLPVHRSDTERPMEYKDYYRILEITRDADGEEIKRAYRKMARIYHPDVNTDKVAATERFKDINEAYTVLSDPDKRRRYDQLSVSYEQVRRSTYTTSTAGRTAGSAGYASSSRPASSATSRTSSASQTSSTSYSSTSGPTPRREANAGSGSSGRRPYTSTISEEDVERIFRGFGWAYSAARGRRSASPGADFSDFFETFFGGWWTRPEDDADSTEFRPGRDLQSDVTLNLEEAFTGVSRMLTLNDGRKVEVSIPAGVATGSKLRVRDQGERLFGRPRGHLYVNIDVRAHPQFSREGDDLRVRVSVPHETATAGGEVKVPTLARPVVLKVPAGTQSGQIFRLTGLGMPCLTPDRLRGDLLVEAVVLPAPKSGGARPSARQRSNLGARVGEWLRNVLGLTLIISGLVAAVAVGLSAGLPGWQLLAGVGAVLLAHGLAARRALIAPGAVTLGASVGYAAWIGVTAEAAVQYILPLIPIALGYYLMIHRPSA